MTILSDVTQAIGHTPLIRLSRFHPPGNLVAKLETVNPAGSIKDRAALTMVEEAERNGQLGSGGTIVEPTSGNTGAGLAMIGSVRGYRVICTVPDKVAPEKIRLLEAYGAEVIITPTNRLPEDEDSYYGVARRIVANTPGAFQPGQYWNQANPAAHYQTTGPEIWAQTDGQVKALVAGVGTGGTITGAARYLREQDPEILIVGADPVGSIYSAGPEDPIHQYHVEGVGEDFYPETMDLDLVDRWVRVNDRASFAAARELARQEGILTGGSGGLAVWAGRVVASDHPDRLTVVIIPDTGRGYLSKVFDDNWLAAHGLSNS